MADKMFIGVDPTAGRQPFAYAALDHDGRLIALAEGELEDVLALADSEGAAFVAVNAPSRTNVGVVRGSA